MNAAWANFWELWPETAYDFETRFTELQEDQARLDPDEIELAEHTAAKAELLAQIEKRLVAEPRSQREHIPLGYLVKQLTVAEISLSPYDAGDR